jgi:hypothetical protein
MLFDKVLRTGQGSHRWGGGIKTFLAFLVLLTSGCSSGFAIVGTDKYSVIIRHVGGTFRERPFIINQEGIVTLHRDENNTFVLRSVGFDGKEKWQKRLPIFTMYGCDEVAFWDDGQLVAYMKYSGSSEKHSLVVSPTSEVTKNQLPADFYITGKGVYACLVLWFDATTLLVYPQSGGVEHIDLIHLDSKSVTRLCDVSHSYGPTLVSPTGRFIVVSDSIKDSLRYRLLVYDLKTEKKVFEVLPPGKKMDTRGVVWSSDDELVFTSDNVIYTQKIGARAPTELFRLKEHFGAWLYAVDNKRNLHYARYDRENDCPRASGGWRVFNLDTYREKTISRLKISDKVLMSPERDKVVAEVEY